MGRVRNGVKYLTLFHCNDMKKASLQDNVYFTIRDIFFNNTGMEICLAANYFNQILTNGVSYEERNPVEPFQYSNALEQKEYLTKLLKWLSKFTVYWFDFEDEEDDDEEVIAWEDWWQQFCELKETLETRRQSLQ
jgi:hypothetical protein